MKKLFVLLSITMFAVGCESMDDFDLGTDIPHRNSFNVKIESITNSDTTRAHLDNLKVVLDDGDKIAIFDNNTAKSEYTYSVETNKFSGTSSDAGESLTGTYALYPSSACVSCSSEKISGTLPETQTYSANSFATNSHIMYANCEALGDEIELKNMVSYIRLHLCAAEGENVVVENISLTTKNGEKISGGFHIDNTADTPELIMNEGGSSSVTLDCSAEEGGGVKLTEEPTIFYICMPVQIYEQGFTITVTDTAGGEFTKSASTPIDLKRNIIKPMAKLKLYSMINTFTSDATVEGKDYVLGNLDNSIEYGIKKPNTLQIKDTSFSGKIGYISFGMYNYGEENGTYSLENVTIKDLTVNCNWGIRNNKRTISIGTFIYGTDSYLKNCTITGTQIVGPKNSDGKFINQNGKVIDDWYDCAIVNSVNATIDGGEYGKLYLYEHAKTTIKGDVKINTLTTATIAIGGGYLKIEGGTIEKIVVVPVSGDKYAPKIEIGAGATVKEIDFNGTKTTGFVNNSGKDITIKNAATV